MPRDSCPAALLQILAFHFLLKKSFDWFSSKNPNWDCSVLPDPPKHYEPSLCSFEMAPSPPGNSPIRIRPGKMFSCATSPSNLRKKLTSLPGIGRSLDTSGHCGHYSHALNGR